MSDIIEKKHFIIRNVMTQAVFVIECVLKFFLLATDDDTAVLMFCRHYVSKYCSCTRI